MKLTNLDWLDYTPLADLYSGNEISILSTLLEIKNERTKSSDKTADETSVTNVMICTPCLEKYYVDNNLAADKYVPTKSDLTMNPYIFGSISFRLSAIEKHSAETNSLHALTVTRQTNISCDERVNQSEAQKAFLSSTELQRGRLKM